MRILISSLLTLFLVSCGVSNSDFNETSAQFALQDPGSTGSYAVKSYLPTAANNGGYQSAIIYYPSNHPTQLLPATTVVGGYTNTKEQMSWLGQQLASHGIIAIVFTPTNTTASDAKVWATGHTAAFQALTTENKRSGSAIFGRVDTSKIGLMGYSYGGAGTIIASNSLGSKVRAIVTFCAYNPVRPTNGIPSLFITGTSDTIASPASVLSAFNSLTTSQPKAFAKFNGLSHLDIPNGGRNHATLARYTVAWAQVFLAGNTAYGTYLNGDESKKQTTNTSIFAKATDYIYKP